MKIWRSVAAAAAMMAVAVPAAAAPDMIATLLAKVDEAVTDEGYEAEGWSQTGSLAQGADRTFTWEPSKARGYVLAGVCDDGCDDFDIALETVGGKTVAEDIAKDDAPVVEVGPLTNARYVVHVGMAKCKRATCRFAVRSYRK